MSAAADRVEPAVARPPALSLARPGFGINHVLAYGQSLSSGWEGCPALSLQLRHDSLMLGHSVRPLDERAPHWHPVGDAQFHPLRATMQDFGAVALGETVLEAAVNLWRGRMLGALGRAALPHRLLASSCGVGGRTLEKLSQGAMPELFNRLRDCALAVRQAAAAIDERHGVVALLLLQGEANSWGLDGGTAEHGAYKALMHRFHRDAMHTLCGITGQALPPGLFTYQTGGAYATEDLAVPQAQLELALELPGCFLVAPVYPVGARPSGHLDANGYRWLGAQFGKVMHRVLTLGQDWKPLHPRAIGLRGTELLVQFHVPVPPLAWGRPLAGETAVDVADQGFTVADAAGVVPIDGVDLAGPDLLRLRLGRAPGAGAILRYADRRHGGRGCLHDSDPDCAEDVYEPDPAGEPGPGIAALAGRPYPLMNWCAAFAVPIPPPG